MASLGKSLRQLLHSLLRRGSKKPHQEGSVSVLDGATAVVLADPEDVTTLAATAEGPRATLADAMGLAMSGVRTTVLLSGADLAGAHDLLLQTAGRHLPLLVYLNNQAPATQSTARGGGHGSYHAVADSGWIQLFARNTQEAVDLGLVARAAAERTLVPCLVAMDDETWSSVQDTVLPGGELRAGILGAASDTLECPTPAQRQLFGATRRRVPRWFDLERPVLLGASQGEESFGLASAAQRPWFFEPVADCLAAAFDEVATATGRPLAALSTHGLDNARIVLLAQGQAVETAEAAADQLRKTDGLAVGVIGVRCLRPFPTAALLGLLTGCDTVVVLERADAPLAAEPPLTRELKAALAGDPNGKRPRLRTAIHGLGGLPLRMADLRALVRRATEAVEHPVYLGVDFLPADSSYPKRQVLLSQLQRDHGGLAELGLQAETGGTGHERPPESEVAIALHRAADDGNEQLATTVATLLHGLFAGRVRSRLAPPHAPWGSELVDRIVVGTKGLLDPGDDFAVDIAVLVSGCSSLAAADPLAHLRSGGTLLLMQNDAQKLPLRVRTAIGQRDIQLFRVDQAGDEEQPGAVADRVSGALAGLLQAQGVAVPADQAIAVQRVSLAELEKASGVDLSDVERDAPLPVRRLQAATRDFSSLPRFWEQVGVLYQDREVSELTPDPLLASGVVPPLSSTFRNFTPCREMLPEFDPALCTGCGRCWTACPDGAIGPVVIGPRALVEAGMTAAKNAGRPADALRMVAAKLGSRLGGLMSASAPPATAGEALQKASDALLNKMELSEERRQSLLQAAQNLTAAVGDLPLAVTEPFFVEPEANQPGSGELLSLAINTQACKGCGACIEVCEPGAMQEALQTPARVEQSQRCFSLWERLPDTSGATIERARRHVAVGPAAGLLLSRHCLLAMASGDSAEAGAGDKVAVRLLLAAAEAHQQPLQQRHVEDVADLQARFGERIRETLAQALPGDDLDALAAGLEGIEQRDMELGALASRIDHAIDHGRVDVAHLQPLVQTARQLADLHWRLTTGPSGLGRARVGLAVCPGRIAAWAASFPYNPFAVPVAVDSSGDTGAMVRGLVEGQLRQVAEDFQFLRHARACLENPAELLLDRPATSPLGWADLTDEERALCPPVILLGGDEVIGGRALPSLSALLESGLPVKVVALADLDQVHKTNSNASKELGLLGLAHRNAFVLQTSIGYGDHLMEGMLEALRYPGPAWILVHVPSPHRHGFPTQAAVRQARAAVEARAWPLFRYSPAADGVFGSRLTLAGNPQPERGWVQNEDGTPFTFAQWAASEGRFAEHFGDGDSTAQQEQVSPEMVRATEDCLHAWRTLQELAGTVTPFTEGVRASARESVTAEHEAELAVLREQYEARLQGLRGELEQEFVNRLHRRLMELSGHAKVGGVRP